MSDSRINMHFTDVYMHTEAIIVIVGYGLVTTHFHVINLL